MGNWRDPNLPWENTGLPWKNKSLPWNDDSLPWVRAGGGAGGGGAPLAGSMAMNADGWTANVVLDGVAGGALSVGSHASPKLTLTVTSRSWNTSGIETTATRTVYATIAKRKPYPNQAQRDETDNGDGTVTLRVVLSEYIYASDQIAGLSMAAGFFTDDGAGGSGQPNPDYTQANFFVANNSTEAYPQPQAVWLDHDLRHVMTSSHTVKLAVMHRFARSGQPVRAVKFIAADQHSNTASIIATALSSGSYSASGLYANYFQAAFDMTQFTVGDLVTFDAVIYPWVGDAYQISVSGESYPSPNLTVLKALCDHNGTYGTAYAYVDGTGAGTPQVSTNPATAAANPYATIAAAANAIQTFNSGTFGRSNVSGGIIRIPAGTTITGFGTPELSARAVGAVPLVIEGVNRATSVWVDGGTSNMNVMDQLKLLNLTVRKSGGTVFGIWGDDSGVGDRLIFEDVTFDRNGQTIYNAWIDSVGAIYFINCNGDFCGQGNPQGLDKHGAALVLGSTFVPNRSFNVIACKNTSLDSTQTPGPGVAVSSLTPIKGGIWAWNFLGTDESTLVFQGNGLDLGPRGLAVVGNIFEYHDTADGPCFDLSGDLTHDCQNLIDAGNTIVGGRSFLFYLDGGPGAANRNKRGLSKQSIHHEWNCKGDVFSTDGALIGNWTNGHKVGSTYNFSINGSSNQDTPGPGNWIGEILGRGEVSVGTPAFTNDQSRSGGGAGNGNYKPAGGTAIPQIPAGETMFAVDLFGTVIPTNGTAYSGAVQ